MRPTPLYAYTQKFEEVFPYYLSIGMTYEQFWEQDCELVKFYRKAAKINRDLRNQDMWLQGLYFYEALCKASPAFRSFGASKPEPYRSEPLDLYAGKKERQKTKEQVNDNKARAVMEAFAMAERELTREEKTAIRKLVTRLCANYDREYGCLPLCGGCYMLDKCWTGACCRYFREAILPNDPVLEAALTSGGPAPDTKACPVCGGAFLPDGRTRYCSTACAHAARLKKQRGYMRKYRG